MSAADLAAVLVSMAVLVTLVVLVVTVLDLRRSLRDLHRTLEAIDDETVAMLEELRGTVEEAGAEVDRVENLLDAAESISSTVEGASRLSYLAFRAPLVRTVAAAKGIGRFAGRMSGTRGSQDRSSVAAPAPGRAGKEGGPRRRSRSGQAGRRVA